MKFLYNINVTISGLTRRHSAGGRGSRGSRPRSSPTPKKLGVAAPARYKMDKEYLQKSIYKNLDIHFIYNSLYLNWLRCSRSPLPSPPSRCHTAQVKYYSLSALLRNYKDFAFLDIFWRMLDEDFNHEDWKVRFAAVERTTLMFRLVS